MKKNIRQELRLFIAIQAGILLAAVLTVVLVMGFNYSETAMRQWMSRLDTAAQTMAEQLRANQVPYAGSHAGDLTVFIFNQGDGTMVVDRKEESTGNTEIWESHSTKLLYEMQKQKRGWITYPQGGAVPSSGQKVIRYINIDEFDWILGVEAIKPSKWRLFFSTVQPSAFGMIGAVLLLGTGSIMVLSKRYFFRLRRASSKTLEASYLGFSGEEQAWPIPEQRSATLVPASEDHSDDAGTGEAFIPKQSASPKKYVDAAEMISSQETDSEGPEENVKPDTNERPDNRPRAEKKQPTPDARQAPEKNAAPPSRPVEPQSEKSDGMEDLTMNMNNVKSPLLKQMLQKLRKQ